MDMTITLERGERVYCGSPEPTDRCEQSGYCFYHQGDTEDGINPEKLAEADVHAAIDEANARLVHTPRLFCGCPLDSGCDGYHSIEGTT